MRISLINNNKNIIDTFSQNRKAQTRNKNDNGLFNLVSQFSAGSSPPYNCSPFQDATLKHILTPSAYSKCLFGQTIINLNNNPAAFYTKVSFCGVNTIEKVNRLTNHKPVNYAGCIIGGAIGDALGSPVEFLDLETIKRAYGENGITDLISGETGRAEISDDTQMTFFTADGLIKAIGQKFKSNELPDISIVYDSYKIWLETQTMTESFRVKDRGWIPNIKSLYARRAPGNTCLKTLESGKMGTISKPVNNSKGNGGVMRVAPAGLMYYNNPKMAFEVGARCAALTHGHPDGFLPAGVFASLLAYIIKGENIESAVDKSLKLLEKYKNNENVKQIILKAKELAKSDIKPEDAIHQIGGGWTGEEAIAIAIYCALKSPDNFEEAVKMSVNHNGDSDSTGAITGNIMGVYLGEDAIPEKWRNRIELSKELETLASDLYNAPLTIKKVRNRYPYNMGRIPNWYDKPQKNSKAAKLNYVTFAPSDTAKMQTMNTKDLIEYKKYLIANKLYIIK